MRGTLVRPVPLGRLRLSLPAGVGERVAAWGARLVVVVALIPIGVYVWAALHRLDYPYELDFLEGGGVEIVGRVLHGQSLYTAPTLGYVSYTYTPLYAWISAAVAEITGLGFLPLRLVSFASSLLAMFALWRLTLAATSDRIAGAIAAGLFAASYSLTGWWLDVGRLDSLFLALTLVALWLGRRAQSARAGAIVGLVGFLAFFTKQTGLVAIMPALLWMAFVRPRVGLSALAVLVVLLAGSTVLLDGLTHGWYRYYVFNELAGQPWEQREVSRFWTHDLRRHLQPLLWLVTVALIAGVVVRLDRLSHVLWGPRGGLRSISRSRRRELGVGYELAAAVGLLAAAWFSRLHTGGYVNVLMPAYAACGLIGGIAFARVRRLGWLLAVFAVAIVIVQLGQLVTRPDDGLPHKSARSAGVALISRLRQLPGPVLVLSHPWYGTIAGKGTFAQADAITEVLRSDSTRGSAYLERELETALDRYRIQAVVLDGSTPAWLKLQLGRNFILQKQPIALPLLRPPADIRSAPTHLYLRRTVGDSGP